MPRPRVYVETTIPSAYYTARTDPDTLGRHVVTRAWWEWATRTCELVTSRAVLRELSRGSSGHVPGRLKLLTGLRKLRISKAVVTTASLYVQHTLMPRDIRGDAMHLALASHHECDILATWNYHHLANPYKLDRIVKMNRELGLSVPRIVSPLELMEGNS